MLKIREENWANILSTYTQNNINKCKFTMK